MVNPSGLKEAVAFERVHLLCFLYFCNNKLTGTGIRVNDLKWFSGEDAIGEHDRHSGEVCDDVKSDWEVRDSIEHFEHFLIAHSKILSDRCPFPEGGYTT